MLEGNGLDKHPKNGGDVHAGFKTPRIPAEAARQRQTCPRRAGTIQ
jgi:hypothetical protein